MRVSICADNSNSRCRSSGIGCTQLTPAENPLSTTSAACVWSFVREPTMTECVLTAEQLELLTANDAKSKLPSISGELHHYSRSIRLLRSPARYSLRTSSCRHRCLTLVSAANSNSCNVLDHVNIARASLGNSASPAACPSFLPCRCLTCACSEACPHSYSYSRQQPRRLWLSPQAASHPKFCMTCL